MRYKTPQQLQKSVMAWRTTSAALFFIMLFVGMGNMNYADQVKKLDRSYQLEKARADYFKNQYNQIIESGACLMPLPDLK